MVGCCGHGHSFLCDINGENILTLKISGYQAAGLLHAVSQAGSLIPQ